MVGVVVGIIFAAVEMPSSKEGGARLFVIFTVPPIVALLAGIGAAVGAIVRAIKKKRDQGRDKGVAPDRKESQ
jgi:hypothetical protein